MYAVIGAVFGEYVGAREGLGIWMQLSQNAFRTDLVFAAIVVTSAVSLVLYWVVGLVRRVAIPWAPGVRREPDLESLPLLGQAARFAVPTAHQNTSSALTGWNAAMNGEMTSAWTRPPWIARSAGGDERVAAGGSREAAAERGDEEHADRSEERVGERLVELDRLRADEHEHAGERDLGGDGDDVQRGRRSDTRGGRSSAARRRAGRRGGRGMRRSSAGGLLGWRRMMAGGVLPRRRGAAITRPIGRVASRARRMSMPRRLAR